MYLGCCATNEKLSHSLCGPNFIIWQLIPQRTFMCALLVMSAPLLPLILPSLSSKGGKVWLIQILTIYYTKLLS